MLDGQWTQTFVLHDMAAYTLARAFGNFIVVYSKE